MYEHVKPGTFAREWHRRRKNVLKRTDSTLTALEKAQRSKSWRPDITEEPTKLLPTAPAALLSSIEPEKAPETDKQKIVIPRFVEYIHKDTNPLVQLYGAYLATQERMRTHPEAMFISLTQLPRLIEQTRALTGVDYDGFFRVYHGGNKADLIPVYTENFLPSPLKMALANGVPPCNVIALVDPYK